MVLGSRDAAGRRKSRESFGEDALPVIQVFQNHEDDTLFGNLLESGVPDFKQWQHKFQERQARLCSPTGAQTPAHQPPSGGTAAGDHRSAPGAAAFPEGWAPMVPVSGGQAAAENGAPVGSSGLGEGSRMGDSWLQVAATAGDGDDDDEFGTFEAAQPAGGPGACGSQGSRPPAIYLQAGASQQGYWMGGQAALVPNAAGLAYQAGAYGQAQPPQQQAFVQQEAYAVGHVRNAAWQAGKQQYNGYRSVTQTGGEVAQAQLLNVDGAQCHSSWDAGVYSAGTSQPAPVAPQDDDFGDFEGAEAQAPSGGSANAGQISGSAGVDAGPKHAVPPQVAAPAAIDWKAPLPLELFGDHETSEGLPESFIRDWDREMGIDSGDRADTAATQASWLAAGDPSAGSVQGCDGLGEGSWEPEDSGSREQEGQSARGLQRQGMEPDVDPMNMKYVVGDAVWYLLKSGYFAAGKVLIVGPPSAQGPSYTVEAQGSLRDATASMLRPRRGPLNKPPAPILKSRPSVRDYLFTGDVLRQHQQQLQVRRSITATDELGGPAAPETQGAKSTGGVAAEIQGVSESKSDVVFVAGGSGHAVQVQAALQVVSQTGPPAEGNAVHGGSMNWEEDHFGDFEEASEGPVAAAAEQVPGNASQEFANTVDFEKFPVGADIQAQFPAAGEAWGQGQSPGHMASFQYQSAQPPASEPLGGSITAGNPHKLAPKGDPFGVSDIHHLVNKAGRPEVAGDGEALAAQPDDGRGQGQDNLQEEDNGKAMRSIAEQGSISIPGLQGATGTLPASGAHKAGHGWTWTDAAGAPGRIAGSFEPGPSPAVAGAAETNKQAGDCGNEMQLQLEHPAPAGCQADPSCAQPSGSAPPVAGQTAEPQAGISEPAGQAMGLISGQASPMPPGSSAPSTVDVSWRANPAGQVDWSCPLPDNMFTIAVGQEAVSLGANAGEALGDEQSERVGRATLGGTPSTGLSHVSRIPSLGSQANRIDDKVTPHGSIEAQAGDGIGGTAVQHSQPTPQLISPQTLAVWEAMCNQALGAFQQARTALQRVAQLGDLHSVCDSSPPVVKCMIALGHLHLLLVMVQHAARNLAGSSSWDEKPMKESLRLWTLRDIGDLSLDGIFQECIYSPCIFGVISSIDQQGLAFKSLFDYKLMLNDIELAATGGLVASDQRRCALTSYPLQFSRNMPTVELSNSGQPVICFRLAASVYNASQSHRFDVS